MKTQAKNRNQVKRTTLALLALGLLALPASAQLNSRSASVQLIATVPDSVTVRSQAIPFASSFTEGGSAPVELVQVLLQWRLRPGHSVHVQPTVEREERSQHLLRVSGFLTPKELALAAQISAFAPASDNSAVVVGALTSPEEKPVGWASLLVAQSRMGQREAGVLHISIAVF